jgi:hypothetical protein
MKRFLLVVCGLFTLSCQGYKDDVVIIDGEKKRVLIPVSSVARTEGLRVFQFSSEKVYDGMIFFTNEEAVFTTVNMIFPVLICSLEKVGDKEFVKINCSCVQPETKIYKPESQYVYEELYSDKNCKDKIKF